MKKKGITHKSEYLISIGAIIAVFSLLLGLNFFFSYKNSKAANIEKTGIISENMHENFENQLNSVSAFSRNNFLNEEFLNLQDEAESNEKEIEDYFSSSLQASSSLVVGVGYIPRIDQELAVESRLFYGQFDSFFSLNNRLTMSYLESVVNTSQSSDYLNGKIYPVYDVNGNVSDFILFARNVRDIRQETYNNRLGIGFLVVSKNTFLAPFSLASTLNGFSATIDVNGEALFASSSSLNGDCVYKASLNFNNYYLTTYYDTSTIFGELAIAFSLELVIYLFIVFAFLFIYYLLHKDNIKSLNYLFDSFDRNKNSAELNCLAYTENDAEVNKVIESYNQMVVSVNRLSEKINEEKERTNQLNLKNKEFEIENLYSQINKHFIINVLSVTHSLINLKDIDKANYCLESLSDYLRYSLSFNVKETTIQNEVESIKSYVNLQLVRYQDIHVTYFIGQDTLPYIIPKLVLQPLVENAFVHGLRNKKGNITIASKKEGNVLSLVVTNDGATSEDELGLTNANIKNGVESKNGMHGIALANIYKRMRLMYGDKTDVYLTSDGEVTSSIIKIELEG